MPPVKIAAAVTPPKNRDDDDDDEKIRLPSQSRKTAAHPAPAIPAASAKKPVPADASSMKVSLAHNMSVSQPVQKGHMANIDPALANKVLNEIVDKSASLCLIMLHSWLQRPVVGHI